VATIFASPQGRILSEEKINQMDDLTKSLPKP